MTDKPLRAKVAWDSHLFALQCIRKRILANTEHAEEQEEDLEAKADIPAEICTSVEDRTLLGLVEIVEYVDISRAPPNWVALLIRLLLLCGRTQQAREAFTEAFPLSASVQFLAWEQAPVAVVPTAWLAGVAEHPKGSSVLLRVLQRYAEMQAEDFCDIIEHVLLARYLSSPHCARILLSSELVNAIVGACFAAGQKAQAPRPPVQLDEVPQESAGMPGCTDGGTVAQRDQCPQHWEGQHILWRLRHLGTQVFEAAFVPQQGFLPHDWPDTLLDPPEDENGHIDGHRGVGASVSCVQQHDSWVGERACQPEPLVIEVSGECLWDCGLLHIDCLRTIMDAGRAQPEKPILHFGRQVIMRHLWHSHEGSYCAVPTLQDLWALACWPLCEDSGLIREALEYLKGTYRELLAPGGAWCSEHEEAIFQMFAALDLQRLPGQMLLSPWVPPQVHLVRLLVQQQPHEQFNAELHQEVLSNSDSLRSIHQQCDKLSNWLNIVEQRTVINKSQINDAIAVVDEHTRRRAEAALPLRRSQLALASR